MELTDESPSEVAPEVVDGLVAELKSTPARPAPAAGMRSDTDDITQLGAYLATVHTAAALAEDIPGRIGDLDITAFTHDIGAHLAFAAEAAQRSIRDLALAPGDEQAARTVFPPRPYHLNTAGDYLERLQALALDLAARAGAVRTEIECYLGADEPEDIPEYARGLLDAIPNPECSCDDGNCDDCKRDRANTESE